MFIGNKYICPYRNILEKVSKLTLYVTRLQVTAIDANKCHANENSPYINAIFDSIIKPYNLRGTHFRSEVDTTYHGLNIFTYQAVKIKNYPLSRLKEASSSF